MSHPINNIAQAVEHPQVKARGSLFDVEHPNAGTIRVVRSPVRLSRTPSRDPTPSPTHGQHTRDVLGEVLGLEADEIARLEKAGVVGTGDRR